MDKSVGAFLNSIYIGKNETTNENIHENRSSFSI